MPTLYRLFAVRFFLLIVWSPLLAVALPEVVHADARFESEHLERTWLRAGQKITPEAFAILLNLARRDDASFAVVRGAAARLGVNRPEDLRSVIELCHRPSSITLGKSGSNPEGNVLEGNDKGSCSFKRRIWRIQRSYPERKELSAGVRESLRGAISQQRKDLPSHTEVRIEYAPRICIREGMSVAQSYLTMIHELEHFRSTEPFREVDLTGFASIDEFVEDELRRPGGELDASVAEGRALRHLLREVPHLQIQLTLASYFDSSGRLVDEAALARGILGKGYEERFRREFQTRLFNASVDTVDLIGLLTDARNKAARAYNAYRGGDEARAFYARYIADVDAERNRLSRKLDRLRSAMDRHFPPLAAEERNASSTRRVIRIGGGASW